MRLRNRLILARDREQSKVFSYVSAILNGVPALQQAPGSLFGHRCEGCFDFPWVLPTSCI